jgi:hypothetical protein
MIYSTKTQEREIDNDFLYIGLKGWDAEQPIERSYGALKVVNQSAGAIAFAYFGEGLRSGGHGVRLDHIVEYWPASNGTCIKLSNGVVYKDVPVEFSDFENFLTESGWVCPA